MTVRPPSGRGAQAAVVVERAVQAVEHVVEGVGAILGAAATTGFAAYKGWPTVVPAWALAGAIAATLVIGTVAGIYPAMRAARLSPTVALAVT